MSSFGDGNTKTEIEECLRCIATDEYSDDFYNDKEAQRQFILDVMGVLRYLCSWCN